MIRFVPLFLLIWVSREFIGGPKCITTGPVSHYTAPGFEEEKAKLARAGVVVLDAKFEDRMVCEACHSCPNYRREIFFEIDEKSAAAAAKMGYRTAQRPEDVIRP